MSFDLCYEAFSNGHFFIQVISLLKYLVDNMATFV
jgi:hypothetical protein